MTSNRKVASLPDIASHAHAQIAGRLDWVGMNHIEIPVLVAVESENPMRTMARVSAFVDLNDPDKRGIHMSRLYLELDRTLSAHALSPLLLRRLLKDFLNSHADLSQQAMVRIDFDLMVRRPALASEHSGWRRYPISLIASLNDKDFALELAFRVVYSSTCPCSAALSRQLIQEQFVKDFPNTKAIDRDAVREWLGQEASIVATPHSQRSAADVRVRLSAGFEDFPLVDLIDRIEGALKTPVQAAVKREDEQAFALLNGQNLMFCEDAGRRVRTALDRDERIDDFWARCSHFESLHPHNAVSIVTKGLADGYRPIDGYPAAWSEIL